MTAPNWIDAALFVLAMIGASAIACGLGWLLFKVFGQSDDLP